MKQYWYNFCEKKKFPVYLSIILSLKVDDDVAIELVVLMAGAMLLVKRLIDQCK